MTTQATPLADRIMESLLNDPRTAEAVIDVVNEQGIVTLTGAVDSEATRRAAEEIARQHEGVFTVINDLNLDI